MHSDEPTEKVGLRRAPHLDRLFLEQTGERQWQLVDILTQEKKLLEVEYELYYDEAEDGRAALL